MISMKSTRTILSSFLSKLIIVLGLHIEIALLFSND